MPDLNATPPITPLMSKLTTNFSKMSLSQEERKCDAVDVGTQTEDNSVMQPVLRPRENYQLTCVDKAVAMALRTSRNGEMRTLACDIIQMITDFCGSNGLDGIVDIAGDLPGADLTGVHFPYDPELYQN